VYNRVSPEIKPKLIESIRKGKSLRNLCKEFSLKKTTAYYYVRKIRGRRFKLVNFDLSDKERLGEFVGIFAGDGCAYKEKDGHWRIRISLNQREKNIIKYYSNRIEELIGKSPRIYFVPSESVVLIEVTSKPVLDLLGNFLTWEYGSKTKSVRLKGKNLGRSFTKGFLRGLIDSDGYVRRGRKEIYFGTISRGLFKNFTTALDSLGFVHKSYVQMRKNPFYKVRLSNSEVDRFCKIIKPIKSQALVV